jgi:uncharacterized protein YecT (DUF1311 family)
MVVTHRRGPPRMLSNIVEDEMRSWCRTSIALLLLSAAPAINIAKADVTTPEFDACIKKSGGVTSEMMGCMDVETKRQDEKLNQSYQKLLASLQSARKTQLVDAQRAWLKYRELNCAFYDDGSGGTAAGLAANDCIMTMTAKRAAELIYLMPNR